MKRLWTIASAAAISAFACHAASAQGPANTGYTVRPVATETAPGPTPVISAPVDGETAVSPDYPQGGYPASQGTGPVSYNGGYSAVGGPVSPGGGGYDQLFPYDGPEPWLHGYYQEIPSYGGYRFFRPCNYKHVLSQSQVAAGWGMSPTMPYSQELFRKYPPPSNTQQAKIELPAAPAPRKPSFDEQVYRAEMARLRAQRDFDADQSRTQNPERVEPVNQSDSSTGPSILRAPAPVIRPATHVDSRESTIQTLQQKLAQQQKELQELEEALRRETGAR